MRMLVEALATIGAKDTRTYIQSGNVVFRHEETDRELPVWAGLVPMRTAYEMPVADPKLIAGIDIPTSVQRLLDS